MSAVTREQADQTLSPPPFTCRSVSRTHVGRVRQINEDRVLDNPIMGLWAIADGMGGHSGGDLAAQQIVDSLRQAALNPVSAESAKSALQEANVRIHARNRRLGLEAGATVVMAVLTSHGLEIAWAGDSRAYRIDAERTKLLTHDHSLVQQLVDAGAISLAMAERHPYANVVTRALGIESSILLETVTGTAPTARFLLCSDGLSRSLREEDLTLEASLEELADTLMMHAISRDGTDNVSLILIDVT